MYQFLFVDRWGCAYDFPVCASSEREARSIWASFDWTGTEDVSDIIWLRVVEV